MSMPVAEQAGDLPALGVVFVLGDQLALESLAAEIAAQHESTVIFDLVPVEAEEGMLGLEETDLQDEINLGMKAGATTGKRQLGFGQCQVFQS